MSIGIKYKNIIKKYGDLVVIPGLSLDVKEGEFFTLLGPSGCGKTTLLRMTAGFNSIEGGEIYFDENMVNDLAPDKRNIGMVFQNYAIFPHLSVKKNIAFGLENRKVPKEDIAKRVDDIMKIVQIEQYKDRLPEKLSGGQQQRVALARAIVIQPDVLLMDEPLSNLDAKLRVELRNAIKEIQNKIGITTVYVTHDQEEAMAVSDRIAVMKDGVIQHLGTPQNIYHRPANLFVSTFIGRSNILDGEIERSGDSVVLRMEEGYEVSMDNVELKLLPADKVKTKVSIRPEEFIISERKKGIRGIVVSSMFLGLNTNYFVELKDGTRVEIIQESSMANIIEEGTEVHLELRTEKINLFDEHGEVNFVQGVINDTEPVLQEKGVIRNDHE